jgi:hypothetical protein
MIKELNTAIGKDCSCNGSPTLRAKLISVGEYKSILEVTPRVYSRDTSQDVFIGKRFVMDNTLVQNMYFY